MLQFNTYTDEVDINFSNVTLRHSTGLNIVNSAEDYGTKFLIVNCTSETIRPITALFAPALITIIPKLAYTVILIKKIFLKNSFIY